MAEIALGNIPRRTFSLYVPFSGRAKPRSRTINKRVRLFIGWRDKPIGWTNSFVSLQTLRTAKRRGLERGFL